MARDLDNALSLSVLAQTEGGQVLLEALIEDMVLAFDTAIAQVQAMTHVELMTCIVRAGERLSLVRQIMLADGEADILKQVLKEELAKEKADKEAEGRAAVDNGMSDHSGTTTPS